MRSDGTRFGGARKGVRVGRAGVAGVVGVAGRAGVAGLACLLGVPGLGALGPAVALGQGGQGAYALDWARQFGEALTEETQAVAALGPDAPGGGAGVVAVGYADGLDPRERGFVVRFDQDGQELWRRELGVGTTRCQDVATDAGGNSYVAGFTLGLVDPVDSAQGFLVKLDPSGQILWQVVLGPGADRSVYAYGVACTPDGRVAITGETGADLTGGGGPSPGPVFVARYDPDGQQRWLRQFGDSPEFGYAVAIDADGSVYATGARFGGSVFDRGAYLVRLDADGATLWDRTLASDDPDASDDTYGVALDAAGNVYVAGRTQGELPGPSLGAMDAFLLKYDRDGNRLWGRQLGTSLNDDALDLAVSAAGHALLCGGTQGSLAGPTAGAGDAYVASFGPDGDPLWARQIGSSGSERANGVAVGPEAADPPVYLGGLTTGALAGPPAGMGDAFVLRYAVRDCYADFDASGTLTVFDFLAFFNAFDAGEAAADCDGSGSLDVLDFLCFQNAFAAGCP